jgi:atypical dual specificity phosphatase
MKSRPSSSSSSFSSSAAQDDGPPPSDGVLKSFVLLFPATLRYYISLLILWPTIFFNRLVYLLCPGKRRLYDKVAEHVVLGAMPLFACDVANLQREHGVRRVVNLCREWNGNEALYARAGVAQLYLPTIDWDIPTLEACLAGAKFIKEAADAGETVYVHCKAGRGRSTCIVLAYLCLYCGMTPKQAHALVKSHRSHISSKYGAPAILECARIGASGGGGSGGSGSGGGAARAVELAPAPPRALQNPK